MLLLVAGAVLLLVAAAVLLMVAGAMLLVLLMVAYLDSKHWNLGT